MSHVTIAGVGALGSHVVQFLRNEDHGLTVIDFDRVERKNVLSQMHPANQVGKLKTDSIAKTAQFLWGLRVASFPRKITSDNLDQLFNGTHLVIDCLDNIEARSLVKGWVEEYPLVHSLHGALAPDGEFGRVVWGKDFEPDAGAEGAATCEDGEHLPFIGLTAAYMARAAQIFFKTGKQVGFQISPRGVIAV